MFPFFGCPDNLRPFLEEVLEGEYDIPYVAPYAEGLTILDIGANIGTYSWWASNKHPEAIIYAYEPAEKNCNSYKHNLRGNKRVTLTRKAVVAEDNLPEITFYISSINDGMHSRFKPLAEYKELLAEQITVKTISAASLPQAHILKADMEGAEYSVINRYLQTHIAPGIISYEYHSENDRILLEALLEPKYHLATGKVRHFNFGVQNWLLKSIANATIQT